MMETGPLTEHPPVSDLGGPLVELLRSVPEIRILGRHEGFDDIDSRLLFRGWTKTTPPLSLFDAAAPDEERARWIRSIVTAGGARERWYIGVGAGRDWLELQVSLEAQGGGWLDFVLNSKTVHNTRLSFVDVCLLAPDRSSVLMLRESGAQLAAFIFSDLREKHAARRRSAEEALSTRLQEERQKLAGLEGFGVIDGGPEGVRLPSAAGLSGELFRGFELPHVRGDNEHDRRYRDEWLRDRLRSSVFSMPESCYLARHSRADRPWWRLQPGRRSDWASDVLYALVGRKVGDQWRRSLGWHEQFLFLSGDATMTMGWETTEHDLRLYLYRTDVLLERARSRALLGGWLASAKDMIARSDSTSDIEAGAVFRRKYQVATLHGSVSSRARDRWLLDCLQQRLAPAFDEYRLSPEQRTHFTGMAELSLGTTLLPWTPIAWRDSTWLPRLWEELQPAHLFLRSVDRSRVLGIRRASRTYEAFLFTR